MTQKALLTFLTGQGFSSGHVNERQYNFLVGAGIPKKHLNEMWHEYLVAQGYSGALPDMFNKWLANPSPITATVSPVAEALFEGDTVGSITNFATLDNTSNYSSSAGTIVSVEWLVDGVDQAGSFTLTTGESVVVRVTDSAANTRDWTIDPAVGAVVPAQFGTGDWSLSNDGVDITLTITTLPDDGGSALTDLEYKVNSGSYTSLGAATTGDYTITASEGNTVTLRAVNVAGNGTASASKTVPAAPATGPTNTVAPVVSGTPTVGETLSTTNGTWSGVGTITYAYQWLDDGADISGATSSTYTLQAAEEGGLISCRVTATDDNGSTAATSNSLGPVAPIITATVAPAAEPLEDGDLLSSIANFATLDTTGNYASSAGTIASVEWLVNGTDQASSFTLSAGESVVVRVTDSAANTRDWTIDASVAAIAPAQFGTGDWSLANDGVNVTLTVSTLPDDGGSALTDLEYKVNSGSWTSLGAATTGDYTITASATDTVTLRAVNVAGNGTASASKTVPASFHPSDLFGVGDEGFFHDFSDTSTLYTDLAGTTAVTASGDPIGFVDDASGKGNNLESLNTSTRPTYTVSGALAGATYGAAAGERLLASAAGGVTGLTNVNNCTMVVAYTSVAYSALNNPLRLGSVATGDYAEVYESTISASIRSNPEGITVDNTSTSDTSGAGFVTAGVKDGSEGRWYKWSPAGGGLVETDSGLAVFAADFSSEISVRGNGNTIYAVFFIDRALTTTEFNDLRDWMRGKVGH